MSKLSYNFQFHSTQIILKNNYIFVDYENVQVKTISLLKGDHFHITIFLGPNNKSLPVELVIAMRHLGSRANYVAIDKSASNALDFCIACYVGSQITADPNGYFHIISKDTGYDSLIKHLKTKNIHISRSASIAEMPCFLNQQEGQQKTTSQDANIDPSTIILKPEDLKTQDNNNITTTTEKPKSTTSDLLTIALNDLIKRKASKPRTVKTLLSTIHAKCGKELSDKEVKSIYNELVSKGYVINNGDKVSYHLPT